jgi:O-antigen/teichoic acid export membrane protein
MTSSSRQLFARNTTYLFIAQITTKILGFISGILLANYLGVENFGLYNFAISFGALLIPFLDLGVDTAFIKDVASLEDHDVPPVGTLLLLKLIISISVFIVSLFIVPMVVEPNQLTYVFLGILITLFRTYSGSFSAIVRGKNRMDIESNIQVSLKVFEISGVLAAFFLKVDIETLLIFITFSSILQLIYAAILLSGNGFFKKIHIDLSLIKKMMRSGIPFALTGISVALYFQMNTVLLKYLADEKTVGLYRSAYNLILPFTAFSASIVVALFSMIAKVYRKEHEEAISYARTSVFYSLLFALPLAFGGTVIAKPLINLLYPESYSAAALTFQICVWWLPVVYITNILGHILGSINKQRYVFYISFGNAVFNIAANLILIPVYADKGAATANVLTESIGLIISSTVVLKVFGNIYNLIRLSKLLLANVGIFILFFFTDWMNIFVLILSGIGIYISLLFILRVITRQDVSQILNIFRKPKIV